jgi:uncharacterized SAM-binding protein YcdF (DUF218 family)
VGKLTLRLGAIGTDGLFTLLLSNVVLAVTGGLTLGWPLLHVVRTARNAPVMAPPGSVLMVLGMRLNKGEVTDDYARRLERVLRLYNDDSNRSILIVGGLTGASIVTEAARGSEYLISGGISSEKIFIEDSSRHTLENLRNARSLIGAKGFGKFTIITNRYHLARSLIIAKGLGMNPSLCGAEDDSKQAVTRLPRLLLEAYYIHWYRTGAFWSRLTRNRKSLKRIS